MKEDCWKECKYANPKSEIISDYLIKKKENEELKLINKKLQCCGNCTHRNAEEVVETCRLLKKYTQIKGCCSEWECEK